MADETNSGVTLVALQKHIGYGYSGGASTLLVNEGDTFTTTAARAERLIAKGTAAKVEPRTVDEETAEFMRAGKASMSKILERDEAAPAKVDGRTKAGKAAKHK